MIEQRRTPLRPKVRLELIDALRGFTLLNMLIFHLLYDLTARFGVPMDWFWQTPGRLWQKLIAGSFIFLSGFSIRFSRSSLRKGLMLLGCGMMLASTEVPRIAGAFGVDTSTRANVMGAVHTAQSVINTVRMVSSAPG